MWPHTLWLYFLIGILVGLTGIHFIGDSNSLLSASGKRVIALAWGFLCASGSAAPGYSTELSKLRMDRGYEHECKGFVEQPSSVWRHTHLSS